VTANQRGPVLIYKNTVALGNHWVEFDLEGTRSNRSAIGAQITVKWNGQQQVQQVAGGSGFAAQNDHRVHFGLGKDAMIESVVVHWPSGRLQTLRTAGVDRIYKVKEPQ
jgi:hypothetical protein